MRRFALVLALFGTGAAHAEEALPKETLAHKLGLSNEPSSKENSVEATVKGKGFSGPEIVIGKKTDSDETSFYHFTKSLLVPNFHVGAGYVYSHWGIIHPSLKTGSWAYTLGISREYRSWIEGGLSYQRLTGTDGVPGNDNIYAQTISIDARWLLWPGWFRPYVGVSLGVGSFRAWNLRTDTTKSAVFAKRGSGWFGSMIPTVGGHIVFWPYVAMDVSLIYDIFLPHAAYRSGGPGLLVSLAFTH